MRRNGSSSIQAPFRCLSSLAYRVSPTIIKCFVQWLKFMTIDEGWNIQHQLIKWKIYLLAELHSSAHHIHHNSQVQRPLYGGSCIKKNITYFATFVLPIWFLYRNYQLCCCCLWIGTFAFTPVLPGANTSIVQCCSPNLNAAPSPG